MKTEEIVTSDLSQFGRRELAIAGELLSTLYTVRDRTKYLGDGIQVFMNKHSGNVFLCDEDYNVAMMNGHDLEDFLNCPECGHEGFGEDILAYGQQCCNDYLNDMNA
jgi:hypothetical protein